MSRAQALDVARLKMGENRRPCPRCNRGARDTALAVRLEPDGAVVWHCHRCGWRGRDGVEADAGRLPPPKPAAAHTSLSDHGRELWRGCGRITPDDAAGRYFVARGCAMPHPDGDLRWHAALRHPGGHVGPALVALVTAVTNAEQWLSLHRTWIRSDGTKASVDPPRLLLKGHPKAGGVIRVSPDDAVTHGLGLAEGIENALSLAHGFTPVWSTIDAGNLAAFPVLNGIEAVTVAVDNDHSGTGWKAFQAFAERWHAAGKEVRWKMSDRPGADLNDWVLGAA